MSQYLILREVSEGSARLMGVTEDTELAPKAIADNWVTSRDEIDQPVRLHFADINDVTTVDAVPDVKRTTDTTKVDPAIAFQAAPVIDPDPNA